MERQRAGSSADPGAQLLPPKTRSPTTLKTVTLDGSLLGAHLTGAGSPQRAGPPGRRLSNSLRSPVPPQPPAQIYLDKGETEDTYLHTLRTHFVRNGTVEAAIPLGRPSRKYSAFSPSAAAAGAGTPPGSSGSRAAAAAGSGPAGLQRQELELWQEREGELLDAQDLRLGQLESALRSREEKREAYVIHRLEAAAAEKVQQLAAQRRGLGRQQQLLARHARHAGLGGQAATGSRPAPPVVVLPALPKSAIKPLLPASPVLACAVKDAREGLSSYQHVSNLEAGLLSKQAFGAQHSAPQSPTALGHFLEHSAWSRPQDRKEAAHGRQLDLVYANMQMLKSTGTQRAAHPLEPLHTKRGTTSSRALPDQQAGKGQAQSQGNQQGLATQAVSGYGAAAAAAMAGIKERDPLEPGQEELGEEGGSKLQLARQVLRQGDEGLQRQQDARKEEVSVEGEEEEAIEEAMLMHRRAAASSPGPEPIITELPSPLPASCSSAVATTEGADEEAATESAALLEEQAAQGLAGDKPQLASSSLSMGQLQEEQTQQPLAKQDPSAEGDGDSAPTANSQVETEAAGETELGVAADTSSGGRAGDTEVQTAGAGAMAPVLESGQVLPDAVMSAEQLTMQLQQTVEEQLFHLASAELESVGAQDELELDVVPAQQGASGSAEVSAAEGEPAGSLPPPAASASEVAAAGAPPLAANSDGEAVMQVSGAGGIKAEAEPGLVSAPAVEGPAATVTVVAAGDGLELEMLPAEAAPAEIVQASEAATARPRGGSAEDAGSRLSTMDAQVSVDGEAPAGVVSDEGGRVAAAVVSGEDSRGSAALGSVEDGSAGPLVSEEELSATLEAVAEEQLQGLLQGSAWAALHNEEPLAATPHSAA